MHSQLIDCLLEVNLADLSSHDFHHFLANASTLGCLGVGSLLDLVWLTLGEPDAKHAKVEAIGGLHIDMGLD